MLYQPSIFINTLNVAAVYNTDTWNFAHLHNSQAWDKILGSVLIDFICTANHSIEGNITFVDSVLHIFIEIFFITVQHPIFINKTIFPTIFNKLLCIVFCYHTSMYNFMMSILLTWVFISFLNILINDYACNIFIWLLTINTSDVICSVVHHHKCDTWNFAHLEHTQAWDKISGTPHSWSVIISSKTPSSPKNTGFNILKDILFHNISKYQTQSHHSFINVNPYPANTESD